MNDLREVEIYLEILKKEFKLFTQSDIAAFLGVHQTTIASWIQRNSVKTLRKYIKNKGLDVEKIDEAVKKYKDIDLDLQLTILENAQKERFKNLEKEIPNTQHNFSINFQVGFYTVIDELRITIFDAVEGFIDRDNDEEVKKLFEDFNALCNYVVTPAAAKMIKTIEDFRDKREQEMKESNARARAKQLKGD